MHDLLRRCRNLLSHPPLWWKDNEANRERLIADLDAALAESERDWSLLEATQESLRDHMAEIQRLRAALAEPKPQRKPLSEEEIRRIKPVSPDLVDFRSGVRCAEQAHGIGEKE